MQLTPIPILHADKPAPVTLRAPLGPASRYAGSTAAAPGPMPSLRPRLAGQLGLSLRNKHMPVSTLRVARSTLPPVLRWRPISNSALRAKARDLEVECMALLQAATNLANATVVVDTSLEPLRQELGALLTSGLQQKAMAVELVKKLSVHPGPLAARMGLAMLVLSAAQAAGHATAEALQHTLARVASRTPDEDRLDVLLAVCATAGLLQHENAAVPYAYFVLREAMSGLEGQMLTNTLLQFVRLEWWGATQEAATGAPQAGKPAILCRVLCRVLELCAESLPRCEPRNRERCLAHLFQAMCRHRTAQQGPLQWQAFMDGWMKQALATGEGCQELMLSCYWAMRFSADPVTSAATMVQFIATLKQQLAPPLGQARGDTVADLPALQSRLQSLGIFVGLLVERLEQMLAGDAAVRRQVAIAAGSLARLLQYSNNAGAQDLVQILGEIESSARLN